MRKSRFATVAAFAVAGVLSFSAPAQAMAAGYGSVIANKTGDTVTMGNDAISRTWSIKDGVLKTTEINNKLG